jgi:hypothetical protein
VVSVPPGWWLGIGEAGKLQMGKVFPACQGFGFCEACGVMVSRSRWCGALVSS